MEQGASAAFQPAPTGGGPIVVSPPGSFDQDVGAFHVKLENGNANVAGNTATLSGTVAVWPKAAPALKMTVRNASVTAAKIGSVQELAGIAPGAQIRTTAGGAAAALRDNWVSVRGTGTLDFAAGPVALTIAGGSFESRPDGTVGLNGGDVSVRGCTHTVGQGSHLGSADVQLTGTLQCGPVAVANSTLRLSPGRIGGRGQFQAVGHTFTMTYAATDQTLTATGAWTATSRGWQTVPTADGAEYQVTNPRVTAALNGSTVTLTLAVDDVQARTKATQPNGNPVAQAGTGSQSLGIQISSGDVGGLRLPRLPQPSDVNKAARDACRAGVAGVPDRLRGWAKEEAENLRNNALAACDAANPFPPSVPSLPGSINANLTTVVN
jgi:hypothetical protein